MRALRRSTVLRPDPIVKSLHGAFCRGASRQDLLQLVADRIRHAGTPYAGVYMYVVQGDRLELAAFAGPPAEITSVPRGQPVESDLTVAVRLNDEILGEIAIEGDTKNAFTEAEENAVLDVANALAVLL